MNTQEILEIAIPATGLYPTLDNLEIDERATDPIIKEALQFYSRYIPLERRIRLSLPNNVSHYTFGLIPQERIPRWIAHTHLLMSSSSGNLTAMSIFSMRHPVLEPAELPWRYQAPTLYVSTPGSYDVTCLFNRQFDPITREVEVDIFDEWFFDLLAARLMISIGRTRRSIVFNNIEFTLDYAEMVSEGQERERLVRENIVDDCNFGLAWG